MRARGSALLVVLVVVFLTVTLAALYVATSVNVSRGASAAEARLAARTAAWSGLNRALLELDDSCSAAGICSHSAATPTEPSCFGNCDGEVGQPGIYSLATNPRGVRNRNRPVDLDELDLDKARLASDGWRDFRDQTMARPGTAVSRTAGNGVWSVRTKAEGGLVTTEGLPYFYAAFRVRAYGTARGETAGLEALVVRETSRPFRYAAFGNATVQGNGSIVTDSWDSRVTTRYENAPVKGRKGDLGSNGRVSLSGGSGQVSGTITENAEKPVPPADIPSVPSDAYPAGVVRKSETFTQPRVAISKVFLAGSDVLTFAPPSGGVQEIWITDEATITGGGQVVIQQPPAPQAPGTVKLYLNGPGPYKLSGNGVANGGPTATPITLQIISNQAIDIAISGGAHYTGVIYAPNARVDLSGTVDLMGGVVAGTVTLNSGNFHYDEALPEMVFRTRPVYRIATLLELAGR